MALYPSLEDMKVGQMMQAQQAQQLVPEADPATLPYPVHPSAPAPAQYASLYPSLDEYMGLQLTPEMIAANTVQPATAGAVSIPSPSQVVPVSHDTRIMAPVSGSSLGLRRAEVSHSIREVILCKDGSGKVGMRLQPISKGVFVVLVHANSPASLAGLRFGDQILQINEHVVAGYSMDKVHDVIRKANPQKITMAVRDRPFERTVTLHKSSTGHVGFCYKEGKIISIVKDSSAARNGLLVDHNLLEVNGQNVVGLKDSEITKIITAGGNVITLTLIPSFIYDHMMKHMATSIVKKFMDHSIPEV